MSPIYLLSIIFWYYPSRLSIYPYAEPALSTATFSWKVRKYASLLHFHSAELFLFLFALMPIPAHADTKVVVNPSTTWGRWQGWGCALAWWANVFGDRDDLADIVFTTKDTVLTGQRLPGLGMTIARYNVGGCSAKLIGGAAMHPSPNIPAFKQIQGYWLNGESSDPASASWDWSVDAYQHSMLQKARDRGADKFELFSNSPMWWMCRNQNPSGADIGTADRQVRGRSLGDQV